jgi:hypothetical protein
MTLGVLLPPPQADSIKVDHETKNRTNLEGIEWLFDAVNTIAQIDLDP